ncbi:hypothetical protein BH11ACT5_BH11ACT5_19950 [soil metagenome]
MRAAVLQIIAVGSAVVGFLALFALIGGLGALRGDWNSRIVMRPRGLVWQFDHAWMYLVPVLAVLTLSAISMVVFFVILVRYPDKR